MCLKVSNIIITGACGILRISGECLNMLANAVKMQKYMNILIFFAFCEYSVCICLPFFWILSSSWYSHHPRQMGWRKVLVFLAQCPHTAICKMKFISFFHFHKYAACIWKLYIHILDALLHIEFKNTFQGSSPFHSAISIGEKSMVCQYESRMTS